MGKPVIKKGQVLKKPVLKGGISGFYPDGK
jgi:hypothetical protein